MPMDAKFFATWQLDNSQTQGMEEFGKAMGFTEEQGKLYSGLTYSFSVSQDGDGFKLEVDFKGTIPNVTYLVEEGKTIDYTSADGRKSKLTLTVTDGNPEEKYEIPESNVTWLIKRTVDGDVMTAVTSMGDASMTQKFNRV